MYCTGYDSGIDVRDTVPAERDGGEAIEEDDDAKQRDGEEPGGVEPNPREVDANLLSKVSPETQMNTRW